MNKFFINRPIFAIVISLIIILSGIVAIKQLAMEQYPDIALPSVNIRASYPGAAAQTVENSVTKVIEKELTGIDGLLYFTSTSSSGSSSIRLTLEKGTDPDNAQVQIQNKVQRVVSRLPNEVQQSGVNVNKAMSNMLMVVTLFDESNKDNNSDVSDYLVANIQEPLSRVDGVGSINLMGQQYAIRIWLDPDRLRAYSLMPSDVESAIKQQNVQLAAGQLGAAPSVSTQNYTVSVTALSLLQTPEDFKNIIVKSSSSGAVVRVRDVADVEMGSEGYGFSSKFNSHPASGLGVQLASGANALDTSAKVRELMSRLEKDLPEGYRVAYANDNSSFVKNSIWEVVKTLVEAIILVVVIMYLFLGNWRATVIPAVTVPVVMLGTFTALWIFGYTINTLTLFAMVMAIGLLIDDTIVVVENVERLMHDEHLSPKEATIKSMDEVTGALIGIALVMSVVFIPMAFFGGSTGVIYRQFSITIVAAMFLSVVMALTLSPALCAILLVAHKQDAKQSKFQKLFARFSGKYEIASQNIIKRPARWLVSFAAITVFALFILMRLPSGFLPNEDQGIVILQYSLPEGAEVSRTLKVADEIESYFLKEEKQNVKDIFVIAGFSFGGNGQNSGMAMLNLKDWSERKDNASAIAARATVNLGRIRDAQIYALVPPPIMGLGQTDGFEMYLTAAAGVDREKLNELRQEFLARANESKVLSMVRSDSSKSAPQLHINFDTQKALLYGLNLSEVYSTLNSAWAGSYVNDFIDRSQIKKVYVQGKADSRSKPEDLYKWTVRNGSGDMVSFAEFAGTNWTYSDESLERFNGVNAYNAQGSAAAGYSSGQAMEEAERIVSQIDGANYAWSGLSYQEKISSGQAPALYALAILVIFLCLAALYESWSIPFAVLLIIPFGVFGTVLAAYLRGLENNIYFQIALLTTIGLSARNAIMMVEFADDLYKKGLPLTAAAVKAGILRIRPIMMTALTFAAGVLPLALSTGVGANARAAIGTGSVGGTLAATVLSIFFIPLFFVIVNNLFRNKN
ncbi:MAG: efflux RND transporter permease subunit [Elusimicrobiota bacterium]|jgi:multidrug efflux pump|nr:efflux RND transporter permease subunit [Elusimicrobiota bacterium]